MRAQFLQVDAERIESANDCDGFRRRQWRDREVVSDDQFEAGVFRNLLHRRVGIKLTQPHLAVVVEIEHAEIRDEPLRPEARMTKIGSRAAVCGAMTET